MRPEAAPPANGFHVQQVCDGLGHVWPRVQTGAIHLVDAALVYGLMDDVLERGY